MAKSLRASSKVKARNARRYGQNTDYAITQAARLHAISQRLAARTKGPTVTEQDNQGSDKEDGEGKQDVQGDDDADSQGWCLCFEEKKERERTMQGGRDEEQVQVALVTQLMHIDVQLLGLINAESIGLSDDDAAFDLDKANADLLDWMFA